MNQEIVKSVEDVSLSSEKWETFVEECKAILAESDFTSKMEMLKGKWLLGKRITEEELNFQRGGYGNKVIEKIALELEVSAINLWKCIQFYKKFQVKEFDEVMGKLPPGKKSWSWYQVCQEVLPEPKEKKKDKEEKPKAIKKATKKNTKKESENKDSEKEE